MEMGTPVQREKPKSAFPRMVFTSLLIASMNFLPIAEPILQPPRVSEAKAQTAPDSAKTARIYDSLLTIEREVFLRMLDRNKSYVVDFAKKDKKLAPRVKSLPQMLSDRLSKLEHMNPAPELLKALTNGFEVTIWTSPTAEELKQLERHQLVKIYYLMEALSDSTTRKQMGRNLEADRYDQTGEWGGMSHLSKSGVWFDFVPSNPLVSIVSPSEKLELELEAAINPRQFDNSYYSEPNIPRDMLFPFHFHAQTVNDTGATFPSYADFRCGEGIMLSLVDLGKFNVDVVLWIKNGDKWRWIDLDLGVYTY